MLAAILVALCAFPAIVATRAESRRARLMMQCEAMAMRRTTENFRRAMEAGRPNPPALTPPDPADRWPRSRR